jgi:chitinase
LLTVAISGYKEVIAKAYDLTSLSNSVDFFTVMSYDYHGSWETVTGHVSPLYGDDSDKYPQYNTDYAMKMLVQLGAEKEKLVVGVPFYGQVSLRQKLIVPVLYQPKLIILRHSH